MNDLSGYKLNRVLYLPTHNKLWGAVLFDSDSWTRTPNRVYYLHFWCWWAEVGKSVSVKQHMYAPHGLDKLEQVKIKNQYQLITQDKLLELWPDFFEKFEQRMLFEALKNG